MANKPALPKQSAGFIETMDCLPVSKLPEGPGWTYEISWTPTRLRSSGVASKQRSIFAGRTCSTRSFPYIAAALNSLPNDTVIDGEVVAIGPDGRPDQSVAELSRQLVIYTCFSNFDHETGHDNPSAFPYSLSVVQCC